MNIPVAVSMSDPQFDYCKRVGIAMHERVIRNGWRARYEYDGGDPRQQHIDGAVAEGATSLWSLLPWTGKDLNTFGGADVGDDVQVKFRPKPNQPDLSVRDYDNLQHRYVLVHRPTPDPKVLWLMGWRFGHECLLDEFKHRTRNGLYLWYVPPDRLRPIQSLVCPRTHTRNPNPSQEA